MSIKEYIGDGVYAEDNGYEITLTTEDGISVTNRIVLDADVMRAFIAWYKRRRVNLHLPQDAEIDEECR